MSKVSVIMCVYNTNQQHLVEAVKSILNQTFGDFEFLIVDDHSSINLYSDPVFNDSRIEIIRLESNHGPAYARNQALNIATGEYIAIMDSDDISLPTRLERQIDFLDKNYDYVACGTWFRFFGIKNHDVCRIIDDPDYYRCCLLFGNVPTILNPSAMIRRKTLLDFSIKYDENLTYGEDYKMWMQLSEHGKITNLEEILLLYRTHDKQLTFQKNKKKEAKINSRDAKQYLLSKIGVHLTDKEKRNYFAEDGLKHNNPVIYRRVLNKLILANLSSNYYSDQLLKKRVDEQWANYVLSIKNPFKLIRIFIFIKGYRKSSLLIKLRQAKRKLLK